MVAVIRRAEKGDRTALPALREMLTVPAIGEELVDLCGGDLAREAQQALIGAHCGNNLAVREALNRKLELLRAELAGPAPAPVERLLVERIGACWLHLHHLEQVYVQKGSLSQELGTYFQRSIDRAHKRYLSAIKALAVVRKLALPVLQVNIARKQVNVAGSCVAADGGGKTTRAPDAPED
jgi:hypothetical protein